MSGVFDDDEFDDEFDDDYDGRPGRRRRWPMVAGVVVVLGLLAAGGLAVWVNRQIDPPGSPGPAVAVDIADGASTAQVAELLADSGVVANARVFRLYLRTTGDLTIRSGSYMFNTDDSMAHVRDVLVAGPTQTFAMVTVPPGFTLAETADRVAESTGLSADGFLATASSGQIVTRYGPPGATNLEGLLAPDTYRVEATATETDVVTQLVGQQDTVMAEVGYDDAEALTGYSAYEVLIVASLIEAEAKVDGDRAKIARVIYNRLDAGMSLGIDATVYYALGRRGGELTRTDLDVNSPYNTRKFTGLPPTPISLPGRASLEAALRPESGNWIYYVLADADGRHAFSSTEAQFNQDVADARAKGLL